jgi:hypothetical protein
MPARGTTAAVIASVAARVLRDPQASAEAKRAAASALTQKAGRKDDGRFEKTSRMAASAAAKVLRDPSATPEQRAVAASALIQRRRSRTRRHPAAKPA